MLRRGVEGVQVVLAGLRLEVRGLAGQEPAGRMNRLAARLEHAGDRILRQPADLEIRPLRA